MDRLEGLREEALAAINTVTTNGKSSSEKLWRIGQIVQQLARASEAINKVEMLLYDVQEAAAKR